MQTIGTAGIVQGPPIVRMEHFELDRNGVRAASAQDAQKVGMASVRDGFGPCRRMALGHPLQDDMVEADNDYAVAGVRRLDQSRDAVRCEIGTLRFLDFKHDAHVVACRPVERLDESRDSRANEARIEARACVEPADLFQSESG